MRTDALVTWETVNIAADRLRDRGERVSSRAVRSELGGGSYTRILEHLRAWRMRAAGPIDGSAAAALEKPAVQPMELPPNIAAAVDAFIQTVFNAFSSVQATATRSSEERIASHLAAHAENLLARDRRHAELITAMEIRLADAETDLDEALPDVEEVERLRSQVAVVTSESVDLRERVRLLEGELVVMQADMAGATEARATAVAMAERADGEAEKWRTELSRAQSELDVIRRETTASYACAQETLDSAREELASASARMQMQAYDNDRLEAELAGLDPISLVQHETRQPAQPRHELR